MTTLDPTLEPSDLPDPALDPPESVARALSALDEAVQMACYAGMDWDAVVRQVEESLNGYWEAPDADF